jgi:hypothetical protein
VKVLGLIGAVDPRHHLRAKPQKQEHDEAESATPKEQVLSQ